MTKRLLSVYDAKTTQLTLEAYFRDNQPINNIIRRMSFIDKAFFAALCDGRTITTTGYVSEADFSIYRAPAVVFALRDLFFPVKTEYVRTVSDKGSMTSIGVFSLHPHDLQQLRHHPRTLLSQYKEVRRAERRTQAANTLKLLCCRYGKDEVKKMLNSI